MQRTNSDQENKENKANADRKLVGGGGEDGVAPLRKKNIFLASDALR